MEPSTDDELIVRRNVGDMTAAEVEQMIMRIRDRRMAARKQWEEAQKIARAQRDAKVRTKIEQQCNILGRELDRLDRTLDKAEQRIVNLCGLLLDLTGELPAGWRNYFGNKDAQATRSGTDTQEG